jgi:hypothetical protein
VVKRSQLHINPSSALDPVVKDRRAGQARPRVARLSRNIDERLFDQFTEIEPQLNSFSQHCGTVNESPAKVEMEYHH